MSADQEEEVEEEEDRDEDELLREWSKQLVRCGMFGCGGQLRRSAPGPALRQLLLSSWTCSHVTPNQLGTSMLSTQHQPTAPTTAPASSTQHPPLIQHPAPTTPLSPYAAPCRAEKIERDLEAQEQQEADGGAVDLDALQQRQVGPCGGEGGEGGMDGQSRGFGGSNQWNWKGQSSGEQESSSSTEPPPKQQGGAAAHSWLPFCQRCGAVEGAGVGGKGAPLDFSFRSCTHQAFVPAPLNSRTL